MITGKDASVAGFAVHCRNITKTYGKGSAKVHALRGVDLDIRKGEMMIIAGPSGCGKTTFVSIISTLLEPDSGTCRVFGRDVFHFSKEQKILYRRQTIGFVFQAFNLLPALTAQENAALPLLIKGVERKKAMRLAAETLRDVGLSVRHNALPSQMSGGEKQRVAVARALIHNPRLVVCDEPTSNLDHVTGQKIMELLQGLARTHGTTLLVVTHDNRIYNYADRIAHMDDGRIMDIEIIKSRDFS
ncbi:ABC transporter ATP-binding protein [Hydrogenimonas cancrithermarum]|uniref:ABC transporter, ATP-binding protein n=1 Tax=Hydrogenimonas cancrithermarum TaxID=2993563 RepID=A0ABM8FLI5_9BACT|nr:ABC transporter ATP-binding protein [Hydrogenimonas cancrithermarum]BDY12303.1 putative ABC transporter, ATP-binding protein [Hydrogenimonas cancrithermarum]